jgi:predicted RNase H-like nuclease (RuvC/YqgF family)
MRVEEVFTGMDAYITKLEKKLKKTENRVDILEGQLRSIVDALEDGWIIDSK